MAAETNDEVEERIEPRGRGRPRLYPWEAWLARRRTIVFPGVDYHCSTAGFVQQARDAASRAGLTAHVSDLGDRVLIVVGAEPDEAGTG